MRILYHHRTQAGDAQGVHIQEIVRAFRDLGHEVRVAALHGENGGAKAAGGGGFDRYLRFVPAWGYELLALGYNLYGARMLLREARGFRPELLYERYSLNTFAGVWAARRLGIPMVLEVNAPLALEQERLGKLAFRRFARFAERWICSNSTKTITVTGVMREILVAGGVPRDHVAVITNGIDPKRFHPGIPGEAVRRRHGLEGAIVIGFVGWFRKWHGLEMLIETFHRSGLAGSGARLLLVGDGPAKPDLDRLVTERGLADQVVFTGSVGHDEIPEHVAAFDVAVQPSAPEYACPMKILEYMAVGKCIVAPDQPNIREVLENRESGLLFTPRSDAAFARAVETAVRDRDLRDRLGRRASAVVEARRWVWQNNAEQALALVAPGAGAPEHVKGR